MNRGLISIVAINLNVSPSIINISIIDITGKTVFSKVYKDV